MARKARSLRPRSATTITERSLDITEGGNSSRNVPRGNFCINPNIDTARFMTPSSYRKGKTVLRIWNMVDPEQPDKALLNGRLSAFDTAGLGGMAISEPVPCTKFAGLGPNHQLSGGLQNPMCSYIIARSKNSSVEGIPFWELPYPKLRQTAKKAFDSTKFASGHAWDVEWNPIINSKMPPLGTFKNCYFVVASVYENGSDLDLTRELIEYTKSNGQEVSQEIPRNGVPFGEGEEDPLCVMQLPISAGRKILRMCNVEKQDYSGNEESDPSLPFYYGDPCGKFNVKKGTVDGGIFFTIYNPDVCPDLKKNTSWSGQPSSGITEYECHVSKTYQGPNGLVKADLNKDQVDNIFNKSLYFWKEDADDPKDSYLLHEPSIEERCEKLALAFQAVPKLLEFCWMSRPEYLNYDSVQAVLNNRVISVAAPVAEEVEEVEEVEESNADPAPQGYVAAGRKAKSKKKAAPAELLADEFDDALEEVEEEDDVPFDTEASDSSSDWDDDDWDENEEASSDFDEDDDEFEEDDSEEDFADVEEQLSNSMSKASAVARSKKRRSKKS